MKYFKFLISILFLFFIFSYSYGWSYPLRQISKPIAKCKFNPWNTLSSSCKISLPVLKPSEYKKYKSDINFYRRIYTVLWMSSYKYGWDTLNGTHLGTDIATSLGTPVYSIGNGKVVYASYHKGRGKVVVIQHKVNGKYVYSNYAHLNKIFVKFGQKVNQDIKIGEVGHSGNSYGNHLHFQIDTNQSIGAHPFWFRYCAKGKSIFNIVNNTFCLKEGMNSTVDSLAFLASNGAIIKYSVSEKVKKQPKISRKNMISLEEIRKRMVKEFLASHKFSFNFSNAGVYYIGKYGYFTISLKDRRGRNFKDMLPDDLDIIYDKSFFKAVSPRGLKVLNGTRKITFLPKKTGVTFFTIKIGKNTIYQKTIRIVKKGQVIPVKYGNIITFPRNKYIGTPSWGINIFQDAGYINLIKVPFNGTYTLSSTTKDVIFCKPYPNLKYINYFHCLPSNSNKKITFTYKDTIFGLFLFKFYSNTGKKTKIIIKNSKGKIISKSKNIYFKQIRLVNQRTKYKSDIILSCKKGLCLNILQKGYIWNNKKLSKTQMKYLLQNMLSYLGNTVNLKTNSSENYVYITRKEFINYLFKILEIKLKNYTGNVSYIDIKNEEKGFKNEVIYLKKLGFIWKDKFSKYHFQPNKTITIEEALYLTNFLLNKYRR